MFGKKRDDVPETITDDQWWQHQKAVSKVVPTIDGPWVAPKVRATMRNWRAARDNAAQN